MKPILLKIKGLNSFLDEQVIDFSELTNKGLFGIFGSTGSGKSTILDAITMALYGKVTRDSKGKGFINSETDTMEVSYKFSIGLLKNEKHYICDRCVKVDKNNMYKTKLARICEVDCEEEKVIAEGSTETKKAVESIIGLSAEDFMRSVVLPQGKFNEFLTLSGKERTNMLERIFNLEKYGINITRKIKNFTFNKEKKLIHLNGQLKQYNGLSKEIIDKTKDELDFLEKRQQKLSLEKEETEKLYDKVKNLWGLNEELNLYKSRYNKLNENSKKIEEQRIELKFAKNANIVEPFINQFEDTKEEIIKSEKELNIKSEKLKNVSYEFEKTKINYEEICSQIKNEKPILSKKATELLNAKDLNLKKINLESEIKNFRIQYIDLKNKFDNVCNTLNEFECKKNNLNKSLENIDSEIQQKTISPQKRKLIYNVYQKSMELVELKKLIDDLKLKIKNQNNNIKKYKDELKKQNTKKENLNLLLKNLNNKKQNLDNNSPEKENSLLQIQNKINELKNEINNYNKSLSEKKQLNLKYNKILNLKCKLEIELNDIKIKYDNCLKQIKDLNLNYNEQINQNMAANLIQNLKDGDKCPICGGIYHLKEISFVNKEKISSIKNSLDLKQQEANNLKENIDKININIASIKADEKNLEERINNIEKNDLCNKNLDEMELNLNKYSLDFSNLNSNITNWKFNVKKIEDEIEENKKNKNDIEKLIVSLNEKINLITNNLNEFNKDIFDKNEKYINLLNEVNVLKNKLNIIDINSEKIKIEKYDIQISELQSNQKKQREELNKINLDKENLINKKSNLKNDIVKIKQSEIEKKLIIDDYNLQIGKVCENKNLDEYLKEINDKINCIDNNETNIKNQYDNILQNKNILQEEIASLSKNIKTLGNMLSIQENTLNLKLKQSGFKNSEEVSRYFMDKQKIDNLEKEIKQFDENILKFKDNIKRLNNAIKEQNVDFDLTNENLNEIEQKKLKLKNDLNECISLKGQKIEELKDLNLNFDKFSKLSNVQKEYQHDYDLCKELENLVKGNNFVKFVATNELKYISKEASKRLKEITRGRYALEIDVNSDFIVRDDFNGGLRRNANTLSGGEIFLTSLSLALALSSQIQLKGKAPLQFFFLDEGFGTLDNELLDLVMDSLERLKNKNFSVGIISHIEELKNRVPVKLIVNSANQGIKGTTVKIEYS